MNQVVNNVEKILGNKFINTNQKLVLYYLKTYEGLCMDSKYVSMQDLLDIDLGLVQQILDAKYILQLQKESEE